MKAAILAGLILCGCGGNIVPDWSPPPTKLNCYTNNVWLNSSDGLIVNPNIHLVFWGDWWRLSAQGQDESAQLSQAWTIIGNDPKFYSPLAEYGIGKGAMLGTYFTNDKIPLGALTGSYITQELQSEITNNVLPTPDSNSIYVVMFPGGTYSEYDQANSFSATHWTYGPIVYATVEFDSNIDNSNENISHELYEAATDSNFGYNGGAGETEIGDYCETTVYTLDGYVIQTLWSEANCRCVPEN